MKRTEEEVVVEVVVESPFLLSSSLDLATKCAPDGWMDQADGYPLSRWWGIGGNGWELVMHSWLAAVAGLRGNLLEGRGKWLLGHSTEDTNVRSWQRRK